jgi:hypothetical protein
MLDIVAAVAVGTDLCSELGCAVVPSLLWVPNLVEQQAVESSFAIKHQASIQIDF